MIKSNLGSAFGVGLGITLGGVIIPRFCFTPQAFTVYPPLMHHVLTYFLTTCLLSFALFCLMDLMNYWQQKRKSS